MNQGWWSCLVWTQSEGRTVTSHIIEVSPTFDKEKHLKNTNSLTKNKDVDMYFVRLFVLARRFGLMRTLLYDRV